MPAKFSPVKLRGWPYDLGTNCLVGGWSFLRSIGMQNKEA